MCRSFPDATSGFRHAPSNLLSVGLMHGGRRWCLATPAHPACPVSIPAARRPMTDTCINCVGRPRNETDFVLSLCLCRIVATRGTADRSQSAGDVVVNSCEDVFVVDGQLSVVGKNHRRRQGFIGGTGKHCFTIYAVSNALFSFWNNCIYIRQFRKNRYAQ